MRTVDIGRSLSLIARYALVRLGSRGDTVRIIRREGVERHPVTAEERTAAVEDLSPLIEQGTNLDLSRIPETKPYFSRFLFADDGHLWVQMETEAGFRGQRWDVFDPSGIHLGSVETELDLGTMIIRDGQVRWRPSVSPRRRISRARARG